MLCPWARQVICCLEPIQSSLDMTEKLFLNIFLEKGTKKNTDLQIRMRNGQLILTLLGYSKRTVSPFREYMFELMVK